MEFLPYGTHVRLRSRLQGTYLHADENGASVSLSPHRASLNTAWSLEAVRLRYLPGTYLSLQSVAYGRYLVVSSLGNAQHGRVLLRQHIFYGQLDNVDALWLAIRVGDAADNEVLIRHCKYKWWHIGVAVQNPNNLSMHWIVETIPWRQQPPALPVPVPDPYLRVCFPTRTIVYARAENHGGMINPTSWRTMDFGGRSVLNLRAELARCLEEANSSDITLYAWTGYDGPRIPLVVDLPSNTNAMVIGVLNTGSPV